MLRWNEILRELVARADLPPAPRDDGTYPVPDSENPFADPQFPFGNPPYAARAYSYVSVAQFEALKAAWYYKYAYNRPSPSRVDSGIQALMPASDLPAYPSEDAVLSGVTAELLKLLFPTSVDEITEKAAAQREAALLSGRATASDIAAGLALGKAVAPLFAARAATDGMRTAGGTPALVQALANAASARGETPWKSLETPPRPPMLPFFGQVKAWMMTPTDIVNERPGPPPSTSSAQMQQELAEVKSSVANITRDQLAIVYKWADGVSTPDSSGPLERHRHGLRARRPLQRGAHGAGLRAAEHGDARRRRRLLGREVRLLQPAALAARPRHQDGHRPAELPVVHVGTLDVLGRGGRGPVVPLSRPAPRRSTPCGTRRRSRGSTAASTTARTSRSARTTARGSAATR